MASPLAIKPMSGAESRGFLVGGGPPAEPRAARENGPASAVCAARTPGDAPNTMSWLKRERTGIKQAAKPERAEMPEGLWTKCDGCGEALFQTVLEENLWTCPNCGHHFRVGARTYKDYLVDEGSFHERHANLVAGDPLEF